MSRGIFISCSVMFLLLVNIIPMDCISTFAVSDCSGAIFMEEKEFVKSFWSYAGKVVSMIFSTST